MERLILEFTAWHASQRAVADTEIQRAVLQHDAYLYLDCLHVTTYDPFTEVYADEVYELRRFAMGEEQTCKHRDMTWLYYRNDRYGESWERFNL